MPLRRSHRTGARFLALALGALIFVVACGGSPGSEFLGKWEDIKNPSDRVEIIRNGDHFLVVIDGKDKKIGAVLRDGALEIAGMMGVIRATYIKSSDTIIVPGFANTQEYKRMK